MPLASDSGFKNTEHMYTAQC